MSVQKGWVSPRFQSGYQKSIRVRQGRRLSSDHMGYPEVSAHYYIRRVISWGSIRLKISFNSWQATHYAWTGISGRSLVQIGPSEWKKPQVSHGDGNHKALFKVMKGAR